MDVLNLIIAAILIIGVLNSNAFDTPSVSNKKPKSPAHPTCVDKEMISNGNFEKPKINSPWSIESVLPGGHRIWGTTPPTNGFDIWQQGAMGSPTNLTGGEPTGQHLSINGISPWARITYDFNVPCLLGSNVAIFSFYYWYQPDCLYCQKNTLGVEVEQQVQTLVSYSFSNKYTGWVLTVHEFDVKACQPMKISFTSQTQDNKGVHIDAVSLKLQVCSNVQMVVNGDFESPRLSQPWEQFQSLPGGQGIWSSVPGNQGFVLWQQHAMGTPMKFKDGSFTGQHLEINGLSPKAELAYQFFVPFLLHTANVVFTFQYYFSKAQTVTFFGVQVHQEGTVILRESLKGGEEDAWMGVGYEFQLQPTLPAKIIFTCSAVSVGGIHIDNVSLKIQESISEHPFTAAPIFLEDINLLPVTQ